MTEKLRFGIIGCSRIAETSTIPAINSSQFAELQFIGSHSNKKAKDFANKFGCLNYGSYEDVLENKDVDAVYISVPVGLHEEWTIKAAEYGKHVLCEKSLTSSFTSAQKMVKVCTENNVGLMEGFMFRFHPQHQKVLEIIKEGTLGDLYTFSGYYGFPPMSHDDIRYKEELRGGVLNDAGCYPICASRIVFGEEPTGLFCKLVIDKESNVDTKASLFLKYPGMKSAQMAVGYDLFYQSTYRLWGSKGHLKLTRSYNIPPDMNAKIILDTPNQTRTISIDAVDHFRLMIDGFSKEVAGITKSSFSFEKDLLNQAKIMEAARVSYKEDRFVKIEEVQ